MNNILFFGDSLTEGYGLSKSQALPALIQEKLNENGLPFQAINAGISGDTTHSAMMRLPSLLLRYEVDIFVLILGINDLFRGILPEDTAQNLTQMIERTKAQYPHVKIILGRVCFPIELLLNLGLAGQIAAQQTEKYNALFPQLAQKYQIAYIPSVLENVMGQPHLNLSDRLHPNAHGYKVMADTVWGKLYPVLQRKYTNGV